MSEMLRIEEEKVGVSRILQTVWSQTRMKSMVKHDLFLSFNFYEILNEYLFKTSYPHSFGRQRILFLKFFWSHWTSYSWMIRSWKWLPLMLLKRILLILDVFCQYYDYFRDDIHDWEEDLWPDTTLYPLHIDWIGRQKLSLDSQGILLLGESEPFSISQSDASQTDEPVSKTEESNVMHVEYDLVPENRRFDGIEGCDGSPRRGVAGSKHVDWAEQGRKRVG